jgi:dihydrofolate reductase
MKYFKAMTTGKTVVMGANTFFSLPGAAPLKNRKNVVLSIDPALKIDGATVVNSIDALLTELCINGADPDGGADTKSGGVFVIGGASVYKALLPYCDTAYVTKVDAEADSPDCYFENLDLKKDWRLESVSEKTTSNGYGITFNKYTRKS